MTEKQNPTDALKTMGTILSAQEGARDAIHLAVEPVIADCQLERGEHVGLISRGIAGRCYPMVGIVDPFLPGFVRKGQRFWLVVYPRTITSLRHVWTHPQFEVEAVDHEAMSESERWLKDYAASIPVHVGDLLQRAAEWVALEEYWIEGGRFEGEWVPDEFWEHYQNVTGKVVPKERQSNFFSCSC